MSPPWSSPWLPPRSPCREKSPSRLGALAVLLLLPMAGGCTQEWVGIGNGEHAFGLPDDIQLEWELCGDTESPDGLVTPGSTATLQLWTLATGSWDFIRIRGEVSFLSDRILPNGSAPEGVTGHDPSLEPCAPAADKLGFPVVVSSDPISDAGELVQGTLRLEAYLPDEEVFQCEECASWQLIVDDPIQVLVSPIDQTKPLTIEATVVDDQSGDRALQAGEEATLGFGLLARSLAPGFGGSIWMDDPYVSFDLPTDGARLEVPTSDLDPDYPGTLSAPIRIDASIPIGHVAEVYVEGSDEDGFGYAGVTTLDISEAAAALKLTDVLSDTITDGENDIQLQVSNWGTAATLDTRISLSSLDTPVPGAVDQRSGELAPGESLTTSGLVVELDSATDVALLTITFSDDRFPTTATTHAIADGVDLLPVAAQVAGITEQSGDGDGRIEPSEQVELEVMLHNQSDRDLGSFGLSNRVLSEDLVEAGSRPASVSLGPR